MKRILISVFILAGLLAGAYAAGAWWLGKQIENHAQANITALQNRMPPGTTVSHVFQRGLFKSQETDTISFSFPPGSGSTRFSIQTQFKQLPLSGLIHQELASADSVVQLDPAVAAAWTGGQPLANVHTAIHFNGGGTSTISLPALNSARVQSVAGQIQLGFTKGMSSYTLQGSLPSLTLSDNQPGISATLSGIQINGANSLVAPYQHLYSGTDHVQIGQVEMNGPGASGLIKHLTEDVTASTPQNGLLDMKLNYGVDSMVFAGHEYGPAHFNIAFRHLDAATLDSLSQTRQNALNPMQSLARMQPLLTHDPEISLDRLSFNMPQGEALVTADFKLQGATQGDFANPLALVGKLQATADLKLPESLVMALISRPAAPPAMAEPSGMPGQPGMAAQPRMPAPDYPAKLDAMVKAGFLTRAGGFISTHIEMSGGKLTLNGKPLNLMAPPN